MRAFLFSLLVLVLANVAQAAPFYENFHNVDGNVVLSNFSYYPNLGKGPQTLSFYRQNGKMMAAGSYSASVATPWAAKANMTIGQFNQAHGVYASQGLRPREISVSLTNGQPMFTVLWTQRLNNIGYYAGLNMSNAEFSYQLNRLCNQQGYRVDDYAAYTVNGQKYQTAVFVKDGQANAFYYGLTGAQFNQKFAELAAQGFSPVNFNAGNTPEGTVFSGVWLKKPGAAALYFGMDANAYQQRFNEFNSQGYRVWKIIGYDNGTHFAAIWRK